MPRPNRGVPEKSKDFKGSMKRLIKSLNKWKYSLVIALVFAFISSILGLITPNKLSDLTDNITEGLKPNINEITINEVMSTDSISIESKMKFSKFLETANSSEDSLKTMDELPTEVYELIKPKMDMSEIKFLAILVCTLVFVGALLNYIQGLILTVVSNKFAKRLRSKVSTKINKLPLKYFDTHDVGDILSRVTNDIDTVTQQLNNSLATLVSSVTIFIGAIIMMFITNYIMALAAIVSSLIGFVFMGSILKKSQKYLTLRQEELGKLNGYIEEMYSGHNVLKAYNGEEEANEGFNKLNIKLYTYNRKSQFLSGIMHPIMGFVGNLGYVAVCIVGALLVSKNVITFGAIVAFMIYVRMFINPLTQIAQAMAQLQSTTAASERVFEFLDEKEMTNEKDLIGILNPNEVKGKIEFKHVKFGYDSDKTIIHDFSAKVKPGEKIAIVGPTGAGKTTMVNLLMKFYEINSGDILIDNVSIKDLTRENIHDLFVMVLQDTWLFEGTIKDNLKFNNKNVSDEEIDTCIKTIGVDHIIKTLPGGIESVVGDNDSISGGEKQLLTIARGMIKDAPFLILDEATSNVDTRTEELVQKAMDKLTKGKTSFIIAHRLSTIKNADLILVMKDGNIVEQGNHNELLKKNGFYAELYNSQFDTISE